MSHTEGRLVVDNDSLIKDGLGYVIADLIESWKNDNEVKSNARRLVACWNALLPVPTEWLEQYNYDPNVDSVITENAKLRIERDELVKALRKFNHDVLEEFAYAPNPGEIEAILAKYPEQS